MDCSLPGFSVHGILQTRILRWVAMPSFRGSSQPRDLSPISCLLHWQAGSLPLMQPGKPKFFSIIFSQRTVASAMFLGGIWGGLSESIAAWFHFQVGRSVLPLSTSIIWHHQDTMKQEPGWAHPRQPLRELSILRIMAGATIQELKDQPLLVIRNEKKNAFREFLQMGSSIAFSSSAFVLKFPLAAAFASRTLNGSPPNAAGCVSTGSLCGYVILESPQSSMELKKIWVHLYGVWTFKNDLNVLGRNQWKSDYIK